MNKNILDRMYSVEDDRRNRHYQTPKQLFINPKYKSLSMASKQLYAILSDRQELSKANGRLTEGRKWVDENGKIFFYFDCRNLSELCGVSTSTINRYKKELKKHDLLHERRQGQGKPNMMYVLKVETVDNTLISQNDYTSVAISNKQDLSKRPHNDTEYSDTEKKDTENIKGNFTGKDSETSLYTFEEYLKKFNTATDLNAEIVIQNYIYKYKKHIKNIEIRYTKEKWEEILNNIMMFEDEHRSLIVDYADMINAIDKHFSTKYDHKEMYYLHNFKGEVKRNRLYEVGVL